MELCKWPQPYGFLTDKCKYFLLQMLLSPGTSVLASVCDDAELTTIFLRVFAELTLPLRNSYHRSGVSLWMMGGFGMTGVHLLKSAGW